MTTDPANPGLCVVKAKGGMGNRMLCAASGLLWARAVGRDTYVDWRDTSYSRDGTNAFPRYFDNPRAHTEAPDDADEVFPPAWQGHLGTPIDEMLNQFDPDKHSSLTIHKKYSVDPSRADYPHPTVVFWYYLGRFASMARLVRAALPDYADLPIEQIARRALREELPLSTRVRERIDTFVTEHWCERVIGVHVRCSDLTTNLDALCNAARDAARRMPDAAIFLATDSKRMEDEYRELFPRVITTPKWFPPEGASMHQNDACADPFANGMEALVDMYLLAHCDALVYASRSTFSEISRLVSDIPPARVLDVDRRDPKLMLKRAIRRWTA